MLTILWGKVFKSYPSRNLLVQKNKDEYKFKKLSKFWKFCISIKVVDKSLISSNPDFYENIIYILILGYVKDKGALSEGWGSAGFKPTAVEINKIFSVKKMKIKGGGGGW